MPVCTVNYRTAEMEEYEYGESQQVTAIMRDLPATNALNAIPQYVILDLMLCNEHNFSDASSLFHQLVLRALCHNPLSIHSLNNPLHAYVLIACSKACK